MSARAELQETCGLEAPAFLRELNHLSALVAKDPFQDSDRGAVYGCYVTFLHEETDVPAAGATVGRNSRAIHLFAEGPARRVAPAGECYGGSIQGLVTSGILTRWRTGGCR